VGQIVRGQAGPGGALRMDIARAVHTAKMKDPADLYRQSVIENAIQTVQELKADSWAVRQALDAGKIEIMSALYDVHTGKVEMIDVKGGVVAR
jgi:carbonic anhydrase